MKARTKRPAFRSLSAPEGSQRTGMASSRARVTGRYLLLAPSRNRRSGQRIRLSRKRPSGKVSKPGQKQMKHQSIPSTRGKTKRPRAGGDAGAMMSAPIVGLSGGTEQLCVSPLAVVDRSLIASSLPSRSMAADRFAGCLWLSPRIPASELQHENGAGRVRG